MRRIAPLLIAVAAFTAMPGPASAQGLPTGYGSVTYTYPYFQDGGVGTATCSFANGVLSGVGTASSTIPGGEGSLYLTCTTYDRVGVLVTRTTGYADHPPVVAGPKTVLDEYPFTVCIEQFVANTRDYQTVMFQGICAPIYGAHEG